MKKELIGMDHHVEVIENIFALLETMKEAIHHTKIQVKEMRYEDAVGLIKDVLHGIESINHALQSILPNLPENHLEKNGLNVLKSISRTVEHYHHGEMTNDDVLQIRTNFSVWKRELEALLKDYVMA